MICKVGSGVVVHTADSEQEDSGFCSILHALSVPSGAWILSVFLQQSKDMHEFG